MCIAPRSNTMRISKGRRHLAPSVIQALGPKWSKPLRRPVNRRPNTHDASQETVAGQALKGGGDVNNSDVNNGDATASTTKPNAEEPAEKGPRYWTSAEHDLFLEALEKYGPKDNKSIAQYVGTRNATQVRTHAQKYFLKKEKNESASSGSSAQTGMEETTMFPEDQNDSNRGASVGDVFSELRDLLSRSSCHAPDDSATDASIDLLSSQGYDSDCSDDSASSSVLGNDFEVECSPLPAMDVQLDMEDLMEIDGEYNTTCTATSPSHYVARMIQIC